MREYWNMKLLTYWMIITGKANEFENEAADGLMDGVCNYSMFVFNVCK